MRGVGGGNKAPSAELATIIVLYHPDRDAIDFIAALGRAGEQVIAVINAAEPDVVDALAQAEPFAILANPENLGLACALNQGLEYAFRKGIPYALMLDQDSRPEPDMGAALLRIFQQHNTPTQPIAALGPRLIDRKRPTARSSQGGEGIAAIQLADTVVTSGSIISRAAFEKVGPMWPELFIDGIDHEWCMRAHHEGYRVCVSPQVMMTHDMGDIGLQFFGAYKPYHRSPMRHYHIVRNTLWLARQGYIPARWRLKESAKLLYRIPLYVLGSASRIKSLGMIGRGLKDGLTPVRNKRNCFRVDQ